MTCVVHFAGNVPAPPGAALGDASDVVRPDEADGDRGLVQRHQPTDDEEAAEHCLRHR